MNKVLVLDEATSTLDNKTNNGRDLQHYRKQNFNYYSS